MARTEAELRREAVRRRLAGESPAEIAHSLGRTRQWVAKWVRRQETVGKEEWAAGAKRGPARAPSRTPAETEALVLAVGERLVANPWAQVGAEAPSSAVSTSSGHRGNAKPLLSAISPLRRLKLTRHTM
jgi:hypothetical protein